MQGMSSEQIEEIQERFRVNCRRHRLLLQERFPGINWRVLGSVPPPEGVEGVWADELSGVVGEILINNRSLNLVLAFPAELIDEEAEGKLTQFEELLGHALAMGILDMLRES